MQTIAPTKSNLMSLKATLEFSKNGYELLDRKRNVLIREMMGYIDRARDIQQKINDTFKEAYQALRMANITMGISNVEDISNNVLENDDFTLLFKSVMGVEVPIVKYEQKPTQHIYSFYQSNTSMDVAYKKFNEIKYLVMEYAEVENAVFKLAVEIRKTQKRANALKNIQIPKYEEMVKFIQEVLEEKDREDFFRLKIVKKKVAVKKEYINKTK